MEVQSQTLPTAHLTEWRDQHLGTRPRPGNLETFYNGRVRDRDFWIFKIGARPGRDRESPSFSLETETRPGRDLNKIPRYWDESETRLLKIFRVGRVRDRDCLGF